MCWPYKGEHGPAWSRVTTRFAMVRRTQRSSNTSMGGAGLLVFRDEAELSFAGWTEKGRMSHCSRLLVGWGGRGKTFAGSGTA